MKSDNVSTYVFLLLYFHWRTVSPDKIYQRSFFIDCTCIYFFLSLALYPSFNLRYYSFLYWLTFLFSSSFPFPFSFPSFNSPLFLNKIFRVFCIKFKMNVLEVLTQPCVVLKRYENDFFYLFFYFFSFS